MNEVTEEALASGDRMHVFAMKMPNYVVDKPAADAIICS